MKKIFIIGFNKCGTTTFSDFFNSCGVKSSHWDGGKIAERFYKRKSEAKDPFLDYADSIVLSDMMSLTFHSLKEPYKDFEYIYQNYPDSYYILNTRNIFDWIKSRVNHGLVPRYKSVFNLGSESEVVQLWISEWYQHHSKVVNFFQERPNSNFMIYDLNKSTPKELVEFLESDWDLDETKFGISNKTK
ncbi:hypothetical protein QQF40_16780 [Cobetia sp. LC6]|uniref:hypothetical protein n=1 Tax=Cobetia sp. LC6 TaxID=3050947 RepID=UPI00255228F8|nr:hypothetical protein [Cobetia sp. LC6]MDL2193033.1 hypothetical protein [Cobetia sp. LC6]